MELLERRDLMAGVPAETIPSIPPFDPNAPVLQRTVPVDNNVTAQVIDGQLVVGGDAGGNYIKIVAGGDGTYWIQGFDISTVNGGVYG